MIVLGLTLGVGLLMIRRSLRPVPTDPRCTRYGIAVPLGTITMWNRWISEVEKRSRLDSVDVEMIGTTTAAIAAERLIGGLAGMTLPASMWVVTSIGGTALSGPMSVIAGFVLSIGGFHLPLIRLRNRAATQRRQFRTSLSAYLDLVSIMLSGGSGIETALFAAARVGDGPTFDAISNALDVSRTSRRSPWEVLADVGATLGVQELPELAATVRLGGEQGARMTSSLIAKAEAMRSQQLAEVEARANAATERMGLPMVLLFLGFLVLLGFPAMQMITNGFQS